MLVWSTARIERSSPSPSPSPRPSHRAVQRPRLKISRSNGQSLGNVLDSETALARRVYLGVNPRTMSAVAALLADGWLWEGAEPRPSIDGSGSPWARAPTLAETLAVAQTSSIAARVGLRVSSSSGSGLRAALGLFPDASVRGAVSSRDSPTCGPARPCPADADLSVAR